MNPRRARSMVLTILCASACGSGENGGASSTSDDDGSIACPAEAYVSNSSADSVSVIDTDTNAVIATIKTDKAPVNPTFTPDHRHVYVSNSQGGTLSIIDVTSHEATTVPAGGLSPSGLAFTPDGKTLLVTLLGQTVATAGSLVFIDVANGHISPPLALGADPERIAITPDGTRAYIDNLIDGTVSVVDVTARRVTGAVSLGSLPFNPLVTPDGKLLYVGVMQSNSIAVIATDTNEVSETISVDSPNGMAFGLDYRTLFVTNAAAGTVSEVSLTMNAVTKTRHVGGLPGYIAVLPDGKLAYFVRPDGTTVEVVDTSTLANTQTITVESGPSVVTICHQKP
jgi:YVTN family beta-propeller protein